MSFNFNTKTYYRPTYILCQAIKFPVVVLVDLNIFYKLYVIEPHQNLSRLVFDTVHNVYESNSPTPFPE